MSKYLLVIVAAMLGRTLQASTPTWAHDVAPLLYAHCTGCHHPGSIAPFSLLSYNDAYTHAGLVAGDLSAGIMPPWPPDTTYSRFLHERILSAHDINIIEQWVSGGKPEGDVTQAPAQPTYAPGSQLSSVSLSVVIPTYTVSGTGDVYRNFPIPTNLSQDMYITAVEAVPGNAAIVHHVLIYQDSTSGPANLDANDPGPGYTNAGGTGSLASILINGWAPGSSPYYTPVGTGFRLPAHTNIVVQVHYPNGSQGQTDSTRINFTLTPIAQRNITVAPVLNYIQDMTNGPINIPANTTKTYYERYNVPANVTVIAAFPHMHLIGRSIKSWANLPTAGDTLPLISIPNWNFHWQGSYAFPNALKIPSGSTLWASAYYDNTSNNPNNPNSPPQTVTAGEATTNEMMIVFYSYLPYLNGDTDIIVDRRVIPQGATSFCSGQSVVLQTLTGKRYTYQWYYNGSSVSGATGASYTAAQAGNYWVKIGLGANTAYSDTTTVSLITSAPSAGVTPSGSTSLCPGQNVTLNAANGSYLYQWFNDTVPVNGATASAYTASAAGSYSVQIYNGCYAQSTAVSVTTSALPSAVITPSGSTTICQGNSVTLGAPVGLTYHWSNGSTTQNISIATAGSYTLTVTNTGNCSALSGATTVTVNPLPTANISNSGNLAFCTGGSVTLTASNNSHYLWSDGTTTQSITASQTGAYTVTVTDANNCTAASQQTQVTVHPLPSSAISANGALAFCLGGGVILSAPVNSAYHWSTGATTQSINSAQSSSYSVTVTDANGCSNSASQTVTVYALPDTSISTNKPTTICPGDTVSLTAAPNLTYHWSNGAVTQSVNATTNITLMVTVTDTHSCTAVSAPVSITVSNNATASITPSGPTSFCTGHSVTLLASPGSSYAWSTGATAQSIDVSSEGNYTVTVTVNGSCMAVSGPQAVVIFQNPSATITASGATTFCSGGNVTLSAPLYDTYVWSNGGSGQESTITETGNYTVTVTDSHGCSASSSATSVTVNPLPQVGFTGLDSMICSSHADLLLTGGYPSGGTYAGLGVTGNNFSPGIAGAGPHVISYSYTDNNGCPNSANQTIIVTTCTGIGNIALQQITCTPNPGNGIFEVSWSEANVQVSEIAIYDLAGKLIYSTLPGTALKQTVVLQSISSACYILVLKTDQGPTFRKLIIER